VRTDVSRAARASKEALLRWVLTPEGELWPDWSGRARLPGRGVHTGLDAASVRAAAASGAFSRGFRQRVGVDSVDALLERAREQGERAWLQRIGLARRAGCVAIGQAAVQDVSRSGTGLVVIASDASDATVKKFRSNAVRRGEPVAALGGGVLGAALGRTFVSVAMVHGKPFAEELRFWAECLGSYDGSGISLVEGAGVRLDRGKERSKGV
jgi:predicted RNA-binding protein YlxR (DUF448 family)